MSRALMLAAVVAVIGVLPAAGDAGPTVGALTFDLEGGVDDDWSIWLVPPGGDNVTALPPRTYLIDISDSSKDHNYHLRGPAVDMATSVGREEYTVWTVTLEPGTYEYFSDSEPREIHETFTVSASAPPPPQPQPPAPPPPPTATRSCRVPRVVGLRLVRARTRIRRANCSVGRVRAVRSRRARGRVVRQRPRPGMRLRRGARVTLVISRGSR